MSKERYVGKFRIVKNGNNRYTIEERVLWFWFIPIWTELDREWFASFTTAAARLAEIKEARAHSYDIQTRASHKIVVYND